MRSRPSPPSRHAAPANRRGGSRCRSSRRPAAGRPSLTTSASPTAPRHRRRARAAAARPRRCEPARRRRLSPVPYERRRVIDAARRRADTAVHAARVRPSRAAAADARRRREPPPVVAGARARRAAAARSRARAARHRLIGPVACQPGGDARLPAWCRRSTAGSRLGAAGGDALVRLSRWSRSSRSPPIPAAA